MEQAESLRIGARSQNVDHHFSCLALYDNVDDDDVKNDDNEDVDVDDCLT